ncbi:MAG TPA: sugar ABC transporter ATP-binding protein [Phycisphaerae bacterium]|nr:sugar ABC transporter ATP-binding protein [Phycisphaerae bacterium]HRY67551.1 sugar ABC transporter ATP-binding protein [Phycisphaerae bacterium]HSA24938.1 sugar ABC transporter ATP-binding protein [Phycisphaerae bacterium]
MPQVQNAASLPILRFDGISKFFAGVTALRQVSFQIQAGHCHALLGENGAGKSTLGKIVAGIHLPNEGTLYLDEKPVRFASPLDAVRAGVGMVHQELCFCPNLTVAENLCLGSLPTRFGLLNRPEMRRRARAMLAEIGADIEVDLPIASLSTGQEQMVQIAAAVGTGARIIVMDEPTSSLATAEVERLFQLVDRLKRRGATLIYVSHRLEEIFRLCDSVTVLRDGQHIETAPVAGMSMERIVQLMIGRPVKDYFPEHLAASPGSERLRVENLTSPGKFGGVSFSVRAGEVVGLAGLVGAGRSEIAQAIFGLDPKSSGKIFIDGRACVVRSPRQAMALGIGYLPEDRKTQGLVLSMGGRANLSLPILDRLSRLGVVRTKSERLLTRKYFDRLRVRTPHMDTAVASLSGGNQQKIAMAKWLASECGILLIDEPTRGVDVGAKAEIHALIDELARDGAAILLISSELPEILNLSTRIVVLRAGRQMGELARGQATQEAIMRLMAGVTEPAAATR